MILATDLRNGVQVNSSTLPLFIELTGSDSGKEKPNPTADGRKHYSVKASLITMDKNGEEKLIPTGTAWISSVEPLTDKPHPYMRSIYQAQGKIWLKIYGSDNGTGYSIIAEKFVRVDLEKLMGDEAKG